MVPNVHTACTPKIRPDRDRSKKNIYLIGPMGSGKTTIGTRLAQLLGLSFYDSDHEIEKRTGASVNLIFEIEGEEGFRKRENQMLRELAARGKGILFSSSYLPELLGVCDRIAVMHRGRLSPARSAERPPACFWLIKFSFPNSPTRIPK